MLVVIRFQEEWEQFWALHSGGFEAIPPTVDFQRKMLAGVFFGGGFSGCDSEAEIITEVSTDGSVVRVIVGTIPWLGPCRIEVYPLHMVEMEKLDQPIVFEGAVPTTFRILVDVQVDDNEVAPGDSVGIGVRNRSAGTIYMRHCPIYVQRREGDTWVLDLESTTPCNTAVAFDAIGPGAVLSVTNRIDAGASPGEHRLAFLITRYASLNAGSVVYTTEPFSVIPLMGQVSRLEQANRRLQLAAGKVGGR